MNKIILALAIFTSTIATGYAQNLINQVPDHATMVIKYSGENFTKNIQLKKIDGYGFIKDHLSKALKIDSTTSLTKLGIDFEKDIYQYISTQDSATSFVSLFNLNDQALFLKLVDANYHAEMKPEKKSGYEFLSLAPDTYIGWNAEKAILVVSSYRNADRYRYYPATTYSDTTVLIEDAIVDTVMAPPPPPPPPPVDVTEEPLKKQKAPAKSKSGKKKPATSKKVIKEPAKKAPLKKKPVEIIDQEVAVDSWDTTTTIIETPKYDHYNDSLENAKREAWYDEQDKKTKEKQRLAAGNILESSFNTTASSIANEISYKKVVDPAAHISLWINSDNILKQYWSSLYGYNAWPLRNIDRTPTAKTTDDAFRSGVNLYFDKDKMRIEQRSFSPDEQMANLGRELFKSKQSEGLAGFINPENIGYLSMSINSEAMSTYYYKLMRQYLSNTPYIGEYSEVVDIYVDLLEIIIDEKALADMMPGNYMFVLHDMKSKLVTYSTYEYDDDFKYKEVQKTKQELSPNFTFVMETKKENFMQKALKVPLKYAKKGNYNYQERNGYYEYIFDEGKYPLSSLYFMMKDGKLIISTSKESIDMTLNNKGYTLDAATKNSVLGNNYSLKINSKKLAQQLRGELNTDLNKKIATWMEENIGDVKMESRIKDGMMQGTTTMAITGDHANSLEFFFNMIDAINDIMESDKQAKEQKLN